MTESKGSERVDTERKALIDELERFKADKNSVKKLLLVVSDESNTRTLSYNFDSVEQLIFTLAIAQAAWVEVWEKLAKGK